MKRTKLFLLWLAALSVALADPPKTDKAPPNPDAPPPISLNYKQGRITVPGGMATLNVPAGFRYLDPADAKKVLVNAWGNPPDAAEGVLGMLTPAKVDPLADDGWAMIITYDEDGYVKDDDAEKMDYTKLLQEMKESTAEASKERVKDGYGSMELVGWAAPPRYDKASHKLYWAKELHFGDAKENTLNYDIRALGRRGVLVIKAVAGKSQLAMVEKEIPRVLEFVEFNEGHRYMDFSSGDKVAAYGIGALVAGKLALKAGLFKGLIALLLASKKLLAIGAVAVLGGLSSLFKRLFGKKEEVVAETPDGSGGTAA